MYSTGGQIQAQRSVVPKNNATLQSINQHNCPTSHLSSAHLSGRSKGICSKKAQRKRCAACSQPQLGILFGEPKWAHHYNRCRHLTANGVGSLADQAPSETARAVNSLPSAISKKRH
mmetsp:Transcript_33717/g.55142  ORF Transcript_33717/g.55142 Transcript_33717/m.55142 type:complete len:117 (-) Transcript_33717:606-956(-)